MNDAFSQGISQSPYGQFGYGEQEYIGNARHMAMGGAGVSLVNAQSINIKNPASHGFNRQNVIFEAGFYGRFNSLRFENQGQTITNGNIQNLALLIPISPKNWTIALGLSPYSNANTRFNIVTPIIGNETINSSNFRKIDGGLNQIFLNNAFKITKGLSIGLGTSLILGTINRRNDGTVRLNDQFTYTTVNSKEVYRFIEFKPSVSYYTKINENTNFFCGATATFNQNIISRRQLIDEISNSSSGFGIYGDTIKSQTNNMKLPQFYNIGFGFDNSKKFMINVEYQYSDYSKYKSYSATNVFSTGHKLMIGSEYIPSFNAVRGYLKRVVYRGGLFIEQTPITIEQKRIYDMGLSTGFGLPMGKQNVGQLNFGFVFGQRGALDNSLIQENYIRFYVAMSLNDKWFIRYKID